MKFYNVAFPILFILLASLAVFQFTPLQLSSGPTISVYPTEVGVTASGFSGPIFVSGVGFTPSGRVIVNCPAGAAQVQVFATSSGGFHVVCDIYAVLPGNYAVWAEDVASGQISAPAYLTVSRVVTTYVTNYTTATASGVTVTSVTVTSTFTIISSTGTISTTTQTFNFTTEVPSTVTQVNTFTQQVVSYTTTTQYSTNTATAVTQVSTTSTSTFTITLTTGSTTFTTQTSTVTVQGLTTETQLSTTTETSTVTTTSSFTTTTNSTTTQGNTTVSVAASSGLTFISNKPGESLMISSVGSSNEGEMFVLKPGTYLVSVNPSVGFQYWRASGGVSVLCLTCSLTTVNYSSPGTLDAVFS